jgi:DNA-binding GntR family transcriptional regulator
MTSALDEKVQAKSLVDIVAERLEAAIISGKLEPGSKLSEQGLASSLGVSRGPLREAIRRLEGRKLLERTPNIGVRVAQLSLKDLHEILVVREALEATACMLAAQNMSDADIAALQKLIAAHGKQKSVQEGKGYFQATNDQDFHVRIAAGSGNARLLQMLCGDLYDLLRVYRYRSSTNPGRALDALQEHHAIVDAIARRDGEAAASAMRTHLQHARKIVEDQLAAGPDGHTAVIAAKSSARASSL